MPILPLPQFEADLEEDRKLYEKLKPPTSIVVRFGALKMVGEFPYSGDAKPGCGSKLVVRTHRGTELGEMLTSTCPNSGCSKSVSRKEMLEYIENSGGRDYPFFNQGRVLRIATAEDLNEQARLDAMRPQMIRFARAVAERMGLPAKIVDAEPILGGDKLSFYFTSEHRIDFRELVNELATEYHARIEMRQVGARDEARLVADYEKCGQHCCCKSFLKVLKPVSMRSAKVQKATLDPLKISGRCGRLMCCLRYEDETYEQLRARLPRKKSRVRTEDGWGTVLDSQILTQLVLVRFDDKDEQLAIPLEDILETGGPNAGVRPAAEDDDDAPSDATPAPRPAGPGAGPRPDGRGPRPDRPRRGPSGTPAGTGGVDAGNTSGERRDGPREGRRDGRPPGPPNERPPQPPQPPRPPAPRSDGEPGGQAPDGSGGGPGKRRRRRRRRGGPRPDSGPNPPEPRP